MSTTTTPPAYRVGDRVLVDDPRHPGVWTISKLNPVNHLLRQGERTLRCPAYYLKPLAGADDADVIDVPIPEHFVCGSVVRVKSGKLATATANGGCDLWVVLKCADKANIAKLGGDGDRYWRINPSLLEAVDPATILR